MTLPIANQQTQYTTSLKRGQQAPVVARKTDFTAKHGDQHPLTLEAAQSAFLRELAGKNRAPSTIRAYATDLNHFISFLHQNNLVIKTPEQIERADLTEYLVYLGQRGLMGVSRARTLSAIREFFRFLETDGYIQKSPAQGVETPKKEKNNRGYLRSDEYRSMLSLAGGNPRDFAIIQVFLQTGIRVSELCNLRLSDIDFEGRTLKVAGKGMVQREIELERKGLEAIKSYLAIRSQTFEDHLFLNYQGQPLGERGVRKLVRKYRDQAGITKHASPHTLRHSFATAKAEKGVSPFQLQKWLGHANLNTTQIYVHIGRQNARKVMEATSL
jgi:site-specific recombinase XerD